jgi:hypothetical protein
MITDKGLAILKELESAVYDFNKQIVHLSEEETVQLNTLLDKLRG